MKSFSKAIMQRIVNLVFVRHGETLNNASGVIQGHTNAHLNQTGREQAERLGQHLSKEIFTRAFSSDLSRANDTAEILLSQSQVARPNLIIDKRIRERGYGDMEGRPVTELIAESKKQGFSKPFLFTPNGAEPIEDMTDRIKDFFQELCDRENDGCEENVLVVTHGGWIKMFMLYLSSDESPFTLLDFDSVKSLGICGNTAVTRLQILPLEPNQPRRLVFMAFNDLSHLTSEEKAVPKYS